MITNKLNKQLRNIIIIAVIVIASLLLGGQTSYAFHYWSGDENGGMPGATHSHPITGTFPQLLSVRQFTGSADTQFPYTDWKTDISAGVVYCSNSGTMLRFGYTDPTIYYAYTYDTDYSDFIRCMEDQLEDKADEEVAEDDGYDVKYGTYDIGYEQFAPSEFDDPIDPSQSMFVIIGERMSFYDDILEICEKQMIKIYNDLTGYEKPEDVDDHNVNTLEKDYEPWTDPVYGPQVCVMESTVGNRGYEKVSGPTTATNDQLAYILTAMQDPYNNSSEHDVYDEADIQSAHWMLMEELYPDGYISQKSLTTNGKILKQKAEEYEKFLKETSGGYKATIDVSSAQVIVNQNSKNYIVGPFQIDYPEYQDISYVKALYITTNTGKTLIYDENNKDLEILCESGAELSNGLAKTYPSSGEYFYIKFSAAKAGYPENISLYVDFEYLSNTQITYTELDADGNIYQYMGHVEQDRRSDYALRRAWGVGTLTYSYKYDYEVEVDDYDWVTHSKDTDGDGINDKDYERWEKVGSHTETRTKTKYGTAEITTYAVSESVLIMQPYVKMTEKPVESVTGQPLRAALEGNRSYKIYEISTNPNPIDLTFELGGKVWVDGTAGKESNFDGYYNKATDTPMSNVKVTLYRNNGTKIAETRTDSNGKYLFTEQNAMYQYYVKFTYNGQYYEPTIYDASKSSNNWNDSSKGLDILSQRDAFNAKFKEIGSHPLNVDGMEVYTRDELEAMGAIDKFGNSTGKVKYADYCMMDSYTCNGTTTKDLYPGYKIFVNDDYLNKITAKTKEILSFIGSSNVKIIYGNPDVMHHINQGYVLREEFDIAVKKDVYKATLEINGKTQTYNYDKRQANENGDWEIAARLSDAYYDATYSREIYREDYEYKAEDYTSQGLNSGFDATAAGISQDKELKVYITYKLTVRNQSETLAGRVTEIVDYYDQEYTFVQERTYLGDRSGNKIADITGSQHSIYGTKTETKINGYKNVYLTGMEEVLLDPDINKDCYIYVTFIVNKDNDRNIILDEKLSDASPIGVGKENIAEINGYKTFYGSKSHAPNENNSQTKPEYSGAEYDANKNLVSQGDIAGKVDKDSIPGNLDPTDVPKDNANGVKYNNFEDDTDKSPNIRIILNRENSRIIDGTVWEDERNITEAYAQVGDGLRTNSETGVNGIRVQLVELLENGQEYIWKEVNSGDTIIQTLVIDNIEIQKNSDGNTVEHSYNISEDGQYKFKSFIPGNYIVRFIYGDGTSSILGTKSTDYNTGNTIDNPVTNLIDTINGYDRTSQEKGYNSSVENIGLNDKSYNGQDYKSTTYQVNIDNGTSAYADTERGTFTYNFSASDGGLYSDAKDIMSRRQIVESYSTENVTNHKAEVLASFERIPTYNGASYDAATMANLLNEFVTNTYMVAESGVIDVNFEYNRTGSDTSNTGNNNIGSSNYEMAGYYNIANLDFGLQERPKSQLKITKQITNVKVTLANGSILFDASSRATNVLWNAHKAHGQDTGNTYTISNNYDNNFMKTPIVRQNARNKGLIQLTMDEELMHGATIQVTYAITIANVGEVDYDENQFYYTGKVANTNTLVKTTPNTLIDYVGFQAESGNATRNNLQFNASQNLDWSVISVDELINNNLINNNLRDNADTYTTIIKTDAISRQLKPIIMDEENAKKIDNAFNSDPLNALATVNSSESVVGVQLILSQMLTSDNSSDDMTYNNLVEIVKTSNQVGRRMEYSVVGNQDPKAEPAEIDADDSQEIAILPPFGQSYIYYVLGGAVAIILIVGITLVIRVVRKRK